MTLKELLEKNDITMYQLAKHADLGQGTVNEIVNGKRKDIQLKTAVKMAQILKVNAEEIYKCIGDE